MQTYCGICIDRLSRIAPCAREPARQKSKPDWPYGFKKTRGSGGAVAREKDSARRLQTARNGTEHQKGQAYRYRRQGIGMRGKKHRHFQGSAFCRSKAVTLHRQRDRGKKIGLCARARIGIRSIFQNETNRNFFREDVSKVYFTAEAALLQVHAYLLELRDRSVS